jgi:uncharacterized membrane protein
MNRKTQMVIAGAGAAAGAYAFSRLLGGKRIRTLPYGYGIKIKKAVTVNAPPEHLYAFWRKLDNLAVLFDNLISIEPLDDNHSRWTLKVPGGVGFTLRWDAEITVDRKNEMIGWRSLDGADIDNAGYVRFERATGGRGTVVRVALQYNPPAGKVGAALATVLGEKPENRLSENSNSCWKPAKSQQRLRRRSCPTRKRRSKQLRKIRFRRATRPRGQERRELSEFRNADCGMRIWWAWWALIPQSAFRNPNSESGRRSSFAGFTHHNDPLADAVAVQLLHGIRDGHLFFDVDVRETRRRA